MFKFKIGEVYHTDHKVYPLGKVLAVQSHGSAVIFYEGQGLLPDKVAIVTPTGVVQPSMTDPRFNLTIKPTTKVEIGKTYPSKGGRMAKVVTAYEDNFMVAYLPDEFHLTGAGLVRPDGTSLKCLSMDLIL